MLSGIQDYYNSSPHLVGTTPRELVQCKQRWSRINDQVCKFVGCFEAALREQKSGQNDDDVMKAVLDIFYNDYSIKYSSMRNVSINGYYFSHFSLV